jgi:hypothetical protein
MKEQKHKNIQQEELASRLMEIDPQCIFAAEGDISGLEGEASLVFRVYDNEKYGHKSHPATLSIKRNGEFTNNVFGEIFGFGNKHRPLLFSCHIQGYNKGLVDVAKMYKQGDVVEGKVYPIGLSVMWKEFMSGEGKTYSDERKKEINKERNKNSWHFRAKIIPEHTIVPIPDYEPRSKQGPKPVPGIK